MTVKPDEFLMKAWKQQVGAAWRLIETIAAESKKLREYQVSAATEAHAAAAAARERFEKATEVQELWRIQGEWLQGSAQRSAAYWRRLSEAAVQLQAAAARSACEPVGVADVPDPAPASAPARKAA